MTLIIFFIFFFFNDTATTEIYTLSLHDALPILSRTALRSASSRLLPPNVLRQRTGPKISRSEEHTSELQSLAYLVCRLLLEKKKKEINKSKFIRNHDNNITSRYKVLRETVTTVN